MSSSKDSRKLARKDLMAANEGRLNLTDSSNHVGDPHRSHLSDPSPQSPCFIHSNLDTLLESNRRDPSYFDSLNSSAVTLQQQQQREGKSSSSSSQINRNYYDKNRPEPRHRGAQGAVEPESGSEGESESDASTDKNGSSGSYSESGSGDSEDDSDRVRSLTRQLAETAVGVREMSKQLGRARVKSTIQSVLIITKARDNHLIKLTRELAIWLMNTPRNGKETGLVVYVDAQLRQSKRFDADGIRRDYPHLFGPTLSRRASYSDTETEQNGRRQSDLGSSFTSNGSRLNSMSHTREESQLRYWTSDMCSRSPHLFDFVVTLGGDGTVLFCSWLFQRIVPPVMPFALGSLGFLTNFDYSDYKEVLTSALDTGIRVNLRMRFTATVYRATLPMSSTVKNRKRRAIRSGKTGEIIMRNIQEGGWNRIESPLPAHGDLRGTFTETDKDAQEDRPASPPTATTSTEEEIQEQTPKSGKGDASDCRKKDKEVMCFSTRPVETFEVLNDLVVDRGPSPYVSLLEIFGDEHHMTTAQADGLCISTPTGSTAYSLSAGGSLVHPEIPAILITPICPHTLSFRPMQLPDSMELRIAVPYNSRSTAWASFDGRGRVELKQGDHIKVTASRYPFPTVCAENQSIDWFQSISRTLKWNERQRQKSFVVVEEGEQEQDKHKKQSRSSKGRGTEAEEAVVKQASEIVKEPDDDEMEVDEQEEEEEAFDIDDSSTVATRASSPDFKEKHHHHHHHRRPSTQSNKRLNRSGSGSSGFSTPASGGSSQFFSTLQPLTMANSNGETNTKGNAKESTNGKASTVKFDDSSTSLNAYKGAQPKDDDEVKTDDKPELQDSNDSVSRYSLKNYQHGIIQPSNRSLLDSPDRFGLAGPPMPPRALSERHLATADFRLDGGKEEEEETGQEANNLEEKKSSSRSRSNSKHEKRATPEVGKAGKDTIEAPLLDEAGPSKSASRLYRKLRSKTRSADAKGLEGLDLTRNNSRGIETALVVYGQDESDSDSTAEG